jgi:phospholipid/cholesterol/gamma-HCH transport system substrate-binding protein
MDKALRKFILLGFFVLVGIILFIVGIFLVGAKTGMFSKSFPISAKFTNAIGLKTGSNVRYNGVRVGIVKSVALINDTDVEVVMLIENGKRNFISKDAIAAIASDGLMGDKIINISPGGHGGAPVQDNDSLQAHNPVNTDNMMATLSRTNENVATISDNLRIMTSKLNSDNGPVQVLFRDSVMAQNLRKSFSNAALVTNQVLEVSESLSQITREIAHGNGALGRILNDSNMARNIAHTIDQLTITSDRLDRVSGDLQAALSHADTGRGAVNVLLTDTAFSNNLQQSIMNLRKASQKMDQDMDALKHSFLLRGYFRRHGQE